MEVFRRLSIVWVVCGVALGLATLSVARYPIFSFVVMALLVGPLFVSIRWPSKLVLIWFGLWLAFVITTKLSGSDFETLLVIVPGGALVFWVACWVVAGLFKK